jgi:hypothetical protein
MSQHPVFVDEVGDLIAGWHRVEAAKKLGWSTIRLESVRDPISLPPTFSDLGDLL